MKVKILFIIVFLLFSGKLKSQNDLSFYLDSIHKNNKLKDSIYNKFKDTSKNVHLNKSKMKIDTLKKITKSDSLKIRALTSFNQIKADHNEAFTCLYLFKQASVSKNINFKTINEPSLPLTLSVNYSERGFYLAAEAEVIYLLYWELFKYPNSISSKRYNLSSQFLGASIAGMISIEKSDKNRIGPGLFWGGFNHNHALVQQIFGGVICFQHYTKNKLPIRFEARFGSGVIDANPKKTRLKGEYWELNTSLPIKFTKIERDLQLYVSPFALYCRIPHFENYIYKFTPSTFMIGIKFGIGIRN